MEFPKLLGTIFSLIGGGAGPLVYYGKSFIKPFNNRKFDWTFGWEQKEYKYEYRNKHLYQGIDLTTICEDSLKQLDPIYKLIFASSENQTNGHIKNEANSGQGIVGLMKLKVESAGFSPKWKTGGKIFGEKLNGVKLIVVQSEESVYWIAAFKEKNIQRESSGTDLENLDWNHSGTGETKKVLKEKISKLQIMRETSKQLKTKTLNKCEINGGRNLKNVYNSLGELTLESESYKVLDVTMFGNNIWTKTGGGDIRGTVPHKHRWEITNNENTKVLIVDMNKAVITPEGVGDDSGIDLKWGPALKATISAELTQ